MRTVLLVGWDAYPHFASGGVYVWQKSLIQGLQGYRFLVFNQLSNTNSNADFVTPENVEVMGVPLFGTSRYEEFHDDRTPLSFKLRATTERVIAGEFLPLFDTFLKEVFSENCDLKTLEDIIFEIHRYFATHDYKKCVESPKAWELFSKRVSSDPLYREMKLSEAVTAFRTVQRTLQILSVNIPKVDLVQCSLAWIPSLLGIVAKRKWGCPVVVTEHGIAFRELLLTYNAFLYYESTRILWKQFATNLIRMIHSMADVMVPVSRANAYWQQKLGVPPRKMRLIYNGIDVDRFAPMNVQRLDSRPTVVSVARIEPFKDIVCLIESIKYVKEVEPRVLCLIYGDSISLDYARRCAKAIGDWNLEENVKFMGRTKEPEKVYNAADVVAVSSITEGLPLTLLEAMACGKAAIAADVGGVRDVLQGCGMLVKSRNPHQMAQAIIKLLKDERLRKELGELAIAKVRAEMSMKKMVSEYTRLYGELLGGRDEGVSRPSPMPEVATC